MKILISFASEHPDIIEVLLQKGANGNHVANDGNTALIWSCVNGKTREAQTLFI